MESQGTDDTITADPTGPDVAPIAPGTIVSGRYEVLDLVGRGGMGAVYRVRDSKLGEIVALKLLTHVSARAEERFLREVRVARKVTHTNVARTHDLGDHGGIPFLTMELVPGEALDDVIEARGTLPPEEVRSIGVGIAEGLGAAHEAGVVHRDLKPANVLIGVDGRVVLTDFGIARMVTGDGKQTGGMIGTPYYMAPEQVAGQPTDGRSDIYALGLILYEMATGDLPFGGDTPISVAVARLTQPPKDPRSLTSVPDPLAELILRCLAKDPVKRPQTAREVALALRAKSSSPMTRPGSRVSLYAPIPVGERTLAILPFVYRGASDHDYLGEGLAEELVDVLSRTKGLKVIALGATRRFAEDRDPAKIHGELGADSVVDGTVQLSGERVRLSARLIEPDGVQRWSDRFDVRFEDVFALQESMGRRVAEALRLELTAAAHRQTAPQEALELYLKARKQMRIDIMSNARDAVVMLDRALELAPNFAPAIAAHAFASIRVWWGITRDEGGEQAERAARSVARAQELAPELAETHLVTAMMAVQLGDFQAAAKACADALEIAPTLPEAHQYLGGLQIEAGHAREGKKRLELTLELDPTLNLCHLSLAGLAVLRGDLDAHEHHVAALRRAFPTLTLPILVTMFRWALYFDDRERAEHVLSELATLGSDASAQMIPLCELALGRGSLEAATATYVQVRDLIPNPRLASVMLQVATELFAFGGELELAHEALRASAEKILIDIEWIERCRLLDPLRDDPRFHEVREIVEKRATSIWRR